MVTGNFHRLYHFDAPAAGSGSTPLVGQANRLLPQSPTPDPPPPDFHLRRWYLIDISFRLCHNRLIELLEELGLMDNHF